MGLIATGAMAQSGGVNHYSAAELQQMAQKLEQKESLRKDGSVGENLEKYPGHFTMLAVRNTSGGAELHQHFSDIFFVVEGNATLTTGGTIVNSTTVKPGEIRGESIQGGVHQKLGKGDVVHISSNTPHQLSIAKGSNFVYFVVKVKE